MAASGKFDSGNTVNNGLSNTSGPSESSGVQSLIGAAVDHAHVEKCHQELKMLNIKEEVMREELSNAIVKQNSSRQAWKTKEHSLNLLSAEKEDALERLRKIQREIQLITDF